MKIELKVMDDDGNWIFGYYDSNNELIGIKVHKKRQYGDGSSKWFIANNIAKYDRTKDLYICEGEKDVLSLLTIGKQAISGTTGAKSIPKDLKWLSEWDNDIYICYDNKKNVIISYQIDWSENLFSCTYLVNEFKYRMSYSSSNLYDRADKKGSLDIKVIKLDE